MAIEVILPRVDMDMTVGRISRWYVDEGSVVDKGAPLFEIETDKAAMEIEAPASGVLRSPFATGIEVAVGTAVGWIAAPGEDWSAGATVPSPATAVSEASGGAIAASTAAIAAGTVLAADLEPALRATPLARRLARENRVELAQIVGSGPRGRVQAIDVEAVIARAPADAPIAAAEGEPTTDARTSDKSIAAPAAFDREAALNIVTMREGPGDPIVFVHGFGADLNGWRPLIQAMGSGARILGVDLPGHGGSALGSAARIPAMADRLAATLATTGAPFVHLVAHSLGAVVATLASESGAFSTRSLFLLSPAGLGPEIDFAFLAGWTRARGEEAHAAWMQRLVADPAVLSPAFVRATVRARSQGTMFADQAAVAEAAFPDGTQIVSILPSLARLAISARVLFGSEDRIIPPHHGMMVPGHVALHRLAGVGHMPHLEATQIVARLIADHVRGAA